MSKKKVLTKQEIEQVQGAFGEIALPYLSLRASGTKGGSRILDLPKYPSLPPLEFNIKP